MILTPPEGIVTVPSFPPSKTHHSNPIFYYPYSLWHRRTRHLQIQRPPPNKLPFYKIPLPQNRHHPLPRSPHPRRHNFPRRQRHPTRSPRPTNAFFVVETEFGELETV